MRTCRYCETKVPDCATRCLVCGKDKFITQAEADEIEKQSIAITMAILEKEEAKRKSAFGYRVKKLFGAKD